MKKNSIILTVLFVLAQLRLYSQQAFTIRNYTEKYKQSIYAMTKHDGKWYVTAAGNPNKGKAYTDIYTTDALVKDLTPFAKEVLTTLDDGTPAFDGNMMYYTSVYKDFSGANEADAKRLKIATASFDGKEWKNTDTFPYNSPQYRTAHPTINKDGNIIVFVSDMPGGKGGMDMYYCIKDGDKWMQPQNITNLNTAGNELFPVFDMMGSLAYSSDGLGGSGGLDLFTATANMEGFDNPVNIGTPLNSAYDDFYLFSENAMNSGYISSNRLGNHKKDDVLFFERNDKHISLTIVVLDKYTSTPLPYVSVTIKGKDGEVFHKGLTDPQGIVKLEEFPAGDYTIQGMLNDVSTTMGKISGNEFSGDNIIKELFHNDPRFTLSGLALNTKTNKPLEEVKVSCKNKAAGTIKELDTHADGTFLFQLEQNSDFEVQGSKTGWLSSEVAEKTTKGLDRTTQLYVDLQLQVERPVNNGTITLKKIHYNYNKCDIRADAAVELERLIKLLNDCPDMKIELSSHTDSRGGKDYNITLSQCRADAAVQYLVQHGINGDRLIAKGYGEERLVNNCADGIDCTESLHEQNRRTEFTVISGTSCGN